MSQSPRAAENLTVAAPVLLMTLAVPLMSTGEAMARKKKEVVERKTTKQQRWRAEKG